MEVLVSLVIIATVLVALVSLENRNIEALNRSRRMTVAAMLARNMMSQIELAGFPEDPGEETGDFQETDDSGELQMSHGGFRWKRLIERVRFGGMSFDNARKITITIMWNEGRAEKKLDVVTHMARRDQKG